MRYEARGARHEMTPAQRKGAIITAVTLAVMALGIYLVVVLKFFVYK
jgi:hypothetical protein